MIEVTTLSMFVGTLFTMRNMKNMPNSLFQSRGRSYRVKMEVDYLKLSLFKFGFLLVAVGFSILLYAKVWGEEWKSYAETDLYECFYDTENMTGPGENIVRVWTKLEYTEKGVDRVVREFGKYYANLSYSLELWEINCDEKKHRVLSVTEYSTEGRILHTNPSESHPLPWINIFPGSIGESLYRAVCK